MNKAFLIGNLTKDPELSTTSGGVSVCKFTLAVNRTYKNAEGIRETDFFNIIAWRALGENCAKSLAKGKKACVVGSIQNRTYDDKDGNKRYVTEIIAEDVEFLTPRNAGEEFTPDFNQDAPAPRQSAAAPAKKAELKPISDDDLPF